MGIALYIAQNFNASRKGVYFKIGMTLVGTIIIYDGPKFIFDGIFGTLPLVRPLFAFHDPLHPEFTDEMHEWHFRSGLDRFIWIVGMIYAMHFVYYNSFIERLEEMPFSRRVVWQGLIAPHAKTRREPVYSNGFHVCSKWTGL